ncbi:MAG: isocitrate dehydrogenase, partial [Gemmatimonadota bacterium]|nr:isocitrate dehydrogenase [Gemmatimonadota bacterium]
PASNRRVLGVDIYVESEQQPAELAATLQTASAELPVKLELIANRGSSVFPNTERKVSLVDHYRCRFVCDGAGELTDNEILSLIARIGETHRWMHVEKLQQFDGVDAFTRTQI